jgi:hypothetical protein
MLDVDYLRKRPRFGGNLVYRYRSGVLRSDVRAALSDMVRSEGGELLPCEPRELRSFMINSLVYENPLIVCDWRGRSTQLRADEIDDLLARIASGVGERVALFLPDHSSLPQHAAWAKIEACCFVVEEPAVTADTLLPVLRYLEARLELKGEKPLSKQRAFVSSFNGLIVGKGADLVTVMRDFDVRLLIWTDPVTNRFDAETYEAEQACETGHQSPPAPVTGARLAQAGLGSRWAHSRIRRLVSAGAKVICSPRRALPNDGGFTPLPRGPAACGGSRRPSASAQTG